MGTCCADGDGLQATLTLGSCSVSLKIMVSLLQTCTASSAASRQTCAVCFSGSMVQVVSGSTTYVTKKAEQSPAPAMPCCRPGRTRPESVPYHAAGVVLFHHLFDMKPGLLKLFPFKDSTGRPVDSVSACTSLAMNCAHPHAVRSCMASHVSPCWCSSVSEECLPVCFWPLPGSPCTLLLP